MTEGIAVFGANGCGKTTLGRELARLLNIKQLDAEDYYFEKSEIPYAKPRPKDEVIALMLKDIEKNRTFVISGVTCDYGSEICSMYVLGVSLSVPDEIRYKRVENRSFDKFGERILPGGDMAEQESRFLEFVKNRDLSVIDKWAKTLDCPILHLDGTKSVAENIGVIVRQYHSLKAL